MGVPFIIAEQALDDAVKALFGTDPRIQSVGIGRHGDGYGFRVVKNAAKILPISAKVDPTPSHIANVPITIVNSHAELRHLVKVPSSGPGSPGAASVVPEQGKHRPLVCGLQIQNFDDDDRQGEIAKGIIIIGTLGCFVRMASGATAILSNNHVVAGQGRGIRGSDRILQPGGAAVGVGDQVATLADFVPLNASPAGASPASGTAIFNDVDAGIASLDSGVAFVQDYLSSRALTPPKGTAVASVGDQVFKVGRSTGLTHGRITDVATTVGSIAYDFGDCWFRRSITIEGNDGTLFSDHGDSGSAILDASGEVVGIVYAGNDTQTYACPIGAVLTALGCTLI